MLSFTEGGVLVLSKTREDCQWCCKSAVFKNEINRCVRRNYWHLIVYEAEIFRIFASNFSESSLRLGSCKCPHWRHSEFASKIHLDGPDCDGRTMGKRQARREVRYSTLAMQHHEISQCRSCHHRVQGDLVLSADDGAFDRCS